MANILTNNQTRNLRQASGEELLVLAVFGSKGTKAKIDRELDRRATSDSGLPSAVLPLPTMSFSQYAA